MTNKAYGIVDRLRKKDYLYPLHSSWCETDSRRIDAMFLAFSRYDVCRPHCDTCFGDVNELYTRLKKLGPVRDLNPEDFSCLYWESAYCGGVDNWKRFLPQMINAGLWEYDDLILFERALGTGLWAWPAVEQESIRHVMGEAFMCWALGKQPEPLSYVSAKGTPGNTGYEKKYVKPNEVGAILLTALLLCRVDPISLIKWMLEVDNSHTRSVLLSMYSGKISFWAFGLDKGEKGGIDTYRNVCHHLARELVTEETLIRWYLDEKHDTEISRWIERLLDYTSGIGWPDKSDFSRGFELFVQSYNDSERLHERNLTL